MASTMIYQVGGETSRLPWTIAAATEKSMDYLYRVK
jgi:hypothetical protein